MKYFLILFISFVCFSCEKDHINYISYEPSESQLLDSVYLYAKDIYLWNTFLPSLKEHRANYNIKNYKTEWRTLDDILYAELSGISSYTNNPQTNRPYEYDFYSPYIPRYSSFKVNSISTKSISQLNYDNKFGIVFGYSSEDGIYIQYILADSPADKGGLARGCKVLEINGVKPAYDSNFIERLEIMLSEDRIELKVETNKGLRNYFLLSKNYSPNPILKKDIITYNNIRYGYISYLRFLNSSQSINKLDDVFSQFDYENIDRLIIDLRYNLGGSISIVDKIANFIIPNQYNNKIMRYEMYNQLMQRGGAEILISQKTENGTLFDYDYSLENNCFKFNKTGHMEVDKIYFIVSNQTASASELLISILQPYIPSEIIGISFDGQTKVKTYGKPVGSIDININNYTFYIPMFYNLNGELNGYYFDGIEADYAVPDDLTSDWGTWDDPALYSIISNSGSMRNIKLNKVTTKQLNKIYYQPIALKDKLHQY